MVVAISIVCSTRQSTHKQYSQDVNECNSVSNGKSLAAYPFVPATARLRSALTGSDKSVPCLSIHEVGVACRFLSKAFGTSLVRRRGPMEKKAVMFLIGSEIVHSGSLSVLVGSMPV